MTRGLYQTAVRRMQRIMLIMSLVVAGPALYGLMRLMDYFEPIQFSSSPSSSPTLRGLSGFLR